VEKIDNKTFYESRYKDELEKDAFEVKSKTEAFKFLIKHQNIFLKNKIALDVGFGSGNILELIKRMDAVCHGIEISQSAIDRLKDKGYYLKYNSGETLPYADEYFDIIISSHTIEHIENEAKILKEIKRVLKTKGKFIMGVPTGKTGYNPLHFRNYSEKDVQRLSSQLNSTCVSYRNFGCPFFTFFYKIINNIIKLLISENNTEKEICNDHNNNNHSSTILRNIYQNTIVKALLTLYKIDSYLMNYQGIEIWYIFQKKG